VSTLWLEPAGTARDSRELERRIDALARALAAHGLVGGRVGLWFQNAFAVVEAHLAIVRIGATRVPVDPAAAAGEATAVFEAARVDAVLTDPAHAVPEALVHSDDEPLASDVPFEPPRIPDDRVLHWFPRSVEQGELRGVPITYGNWEARLRASDAIFRRGGYGPPLGDDDRFLTCQQLMHGTGMIGTFPFLRLGLDQVLLERFDAAVAQAAIRDHAVTTTFMVPGMVTRLVEAGGAPELRRLLYGGAPFPRDELLRAIETFGGALVQLYGHWAGAWPLSILSGEDHLRIGRTDTPIAASCGRPVPEFETRLRAVAGTAGDVRELCVRGPTVVPDFADPSGWYGVGDLMRQDDEGYLYWAGRLDGLINTGAYHVYPGEIEEALATLPEVRAARVVGEPDPRWGEAVVAYVVGPEGDAAAMRVALRDRLAPYKIPKRIHFVDELPHRV
jgi:acyl-CoA synthetase (AMP-forming)/AMP-acid ligase II